MGRAPEGHSEMESLVAFALEMRRLIVDQTAIMKPAEFKDVAFDCAVKQVTWPEWNPPGRV